MDDVKQFKKNKKRINRQIDKKYPGAFVTWDNDDNPTLTLQDNQIGKQNDIIAYVKELVEQYGGECEFYPEQAYKGNVK